ncbi:MAG: hypothetical protein LBC84_02475 [Prevotellaceae bacterium]|nr:hypothetical protein [Prevotellaceae bacterium]
MKKLHVFLLMVCPLLLIGPSLVAQPGKYGDGPDSTECRIKLSFYYSYVRSGDVMAAVPSWRTAVALCPRTASQFPYSDGQTIIKTLLKQPEIEAEHRVGLIDSLMLMYDIRIQYYPSHPVNGPMANAISALTNKIIDMGVYMPDAKEKRMAELEKLLSMAGASTITPMLARYMELTGVLFTEGKRTADDVMDAYERLSAILDIKESENPENEEIFSIRQMIENYLFSTGVATCENLIELFTPRFEANPDDLELVSKIASMLTYAECTTSDLYLKAVTALNKLAPSYQTAKYLSIVHTTKNEFTTAIKYLQEAIDSPDIPTLEKGKCLVDQGVLYYKLNNIGRAMAAANAAIAASPTARGKAYMLMANIWAGQRCGDNDIEKRAVFWVAVDYLAKARAADPSCAQEADRLASQYRQWFPLQEDAFMYDLIEGSSFVVSCGSLRETTTVRTRK